MQMTVMTKAAMDVAKAMVVKIFLRRTVKTTATTARIRMTIPKSIPSFDLIKDTDMLSVVPMLAFTVTAGRKTPIRTSRAPA